MPPAPCRPSATQQGTYARLCQGVNGAIGANGAGGIHRAGRRGSEPPRASGWIGEDLDGGAVPFAPAGVSPHCPMRCWCTWFEPVTRGIACCELTAYGHNNSERASSPTREVRVAPAMKRSPETLDTAARARDALAIAAGAVPSLPPPIGLVMTTRSLQGWTSPMRATTWHYAMSASTRSWLGIQDGHEIIRHCLDR